MNSEDIWYKFSEKLKYFLLKRVGDISIAEDLLQEVFIKIHTNISKLNDAEKVEKWVFQIAYNQLKDHFRKVNKIASDEPINEDIISLSEENHLEDLSACLRPFIHSLPAIYQEVIELSEIQGMKQKEVANKLALSVSGAKSRIQRGRELIKQHFIECCHFHLDENGKLKGEHSHSHEDWNCEDDDCMIHSNKSF